MKEAGLILVSARHQNWEAASRRWLERGVISPAIVIHAGHKRGVRFARWPIRRREKVNEGFMSQDEASFGDRATENATKIVELRQLRPFCRHVATSSLCRTPDSRDRPRTRGRFRCRVPKCDNTVIDSSQSLSEPGDSTIVYTETLTFDHSRTFKDKSWRVNGLRHSS